RLVIAEVVEIAERDVLQAVAVRADLLEDEQAALQLPLIVTEPAERSVGPEMHVVARMLVEARLHGRLRRILQILDHAPEQRPGGDSAEAETDQDAENANHDG